MNCCTIKGIPYNFDGCLTLESKVIQLSQAVCVMADAVDNEFEQWLENYVRNNLSRIFGEIMYVPETETIRFSVNIDNL